MKTMLDSLLDLSRLESGQDDAKLEHINIAPVLESIASEYRAIATKKHLRLEIDGDTSLIVQTDPEKIRRVVQNILINALEYTDEGSVSLRWGRDDAEERWFIIIADTGPGIESTGPTALAHELRTPRPLDKPGTCFSGEGIGLTIVKRLCEALGASMVVESSAESGTQFTLHFPLEYEVSCV